MNFSDLKIILFTNKNALKPQEKINIISAFSNKNIGVINSREDIISLIDLDQIENQIIIDCTFTEGFN